MSARSPSGRKARLEKESVRYPISLWYCKRMRPSRESLEKLKSTTRSSARTWASPSSTSEPPEGRSATSIPSRRRRKKSSWPSDADALLAWMKTRRAASSARTAAANSPSSSPSSVFCRFCCWRATQEERVNSAPSFSVAAIFPAGPSKAAWRMTTCLRSLKSLHPTWRTKREIVASERPRARASWPMEEKRNPSVLLEM